MSDAFVITDAMKAKEEERADQWLEKARATPYREFIEGADPRFCNDSEPTPSTIDKFKPDSARRHFFDVVCGNPERG